MNLSESERRQLRQWSKDEAAYQELLAFLQAKWSVESQEAEKALQKSEAMFKKTQAVAGIGSWELDLATGKNYWSDEFFRICGLEPHSVEPSTELRLSLVHPDDREEAAESMRRTQNEAIPYHLEKRILRPNGDIRWVESRGELIYDADTQSQKIVGTFLDITERKIVEWALIESEQRAMALLDAFPDIVFTFSRKGRYLEYYGNKAELIDDADQLIGSTISEQFGQEIGDYIVAYIEKTLDTGEMQTFEYQLQLETGLREFEARTIVSGENAVIAVVRDITDERIAEKAIRRSEERYRSMLSAMVEGVVLHDRDATPIMCNDAALEILGLSREELLSNLQDPPRVSPIKENNEPFRIHEYPAVVSLETGEPQSKVLMGFHHPKTGTVRWVHVNTRPLKESEDGKPYAVLATFDDVTEERQAQEIQLNVAIERERSNVLSQFIQMTSHEFRTPLSVIATNLHLISKLNDEAQRIAKIERINKQIFHLNTLIEMQLLMTKLDSGVPMRRNPISVEQLIDSTVSALQAKLLQKDLNLHHEIIPKNLSINVDGDYFKQALKQVLDNAISYSNIGATIYFRAHQTQTQVIISIEDEGIGLAEEDIPFIFERFWRKDKSHSEAGFGLGLSLAKKVVELHNGDIEVSSELNRGSIFTIMLPFET